MDFSRSEAVEMMDSLKEQKSGNYLAEMIRLDEENQVLITALNNVKNQRDHLLQTGAASISKINVQAGTKKNGGAQKTLWQLK